MLANIEFLMQTLWRIFWVCGIEVNVDFPNQQMIRFCSRQFGQSRSWFASANINFVDHFDCKPNLSFGSLKPTSIFRTSVAHLTSAERRTSGRNGSRATSSETWESRPRRPDGPIPFTPKGRPMETDGLKCTRASSRSRLCVDRCSRSPSCLYQTMGSVSYLKLELTS